MTNEIEIPSSPGDSSKIYEGGNLNPIKIEELRNNPTAIKQLINQHNILESNLKDKDRTMQGLKSQIEYLNTSPYTSIICLIINIAGTILISIGTTLLSDPKSNYPWVLIFIGGGLVLLGSLGPLLYPYARKWFNS